MFMQTVVTHPLNGRFLGKFSSVITDDGLSAQQWILGETSHDWSVMSSMTGPSFGSDLNHSLFLPSYILNCRTH